MLGPLLGQQRLDSELAKAFAVRLGVIPSVPQHRLRSTLGVSRLAGDRWDRVEQWRQLGTRLWRYYLVFEEFRSPIPRRRRERQITGASCDQTHPIPDGSGWAADRASAGPPQELVQHGLDVSRADGLFHCGPE